MNANRKQNVSRLLMAVALLSMAWVSASPLASAKNETKAPVEKPADKAAASAVTPQTPPSNPDWKKRCQDIKEGEKVTGQYCEGVQSLYVIQNDKEGKPGTPQRIAELAVGFPPGTSTKTAQAVVILPLGIVVNEKIIVEVDGSSIEKIETRFCDNGGCVALFNLDKGALEKMRKGQEISFRTKSAGNQPVLIGLPLSAFGSVMDEITPKK